MASTNGRNSRPASLPRLLEEGFPWPKDFDLDTYCYAGHFGIRRGEAKRLRFRIDKAIGQHLIESPLARDQTVREVDSRLEITATVEDTELLHRWLRGWGEQISDIRFESLCQPGALDANRV